MCENVNMMMMMMTTRMMMVAFPILSSAEYIYHLFFTCHTYLHCSSPGIWYIPLPKQLNVPSIFHEKKRSENKKERLKQMSFNFIDDMFVMLPGEMLSR